MPVNISVEKLSEDEARGELIRLAKVLKNFILLKWILAIWNSKLIIKIKLRHLTNLKSNII